LNFEFLYYLCIVLPIIVLLINTFLSVLIYKEVARDWLNDPLATIKQRVEKVPIPVQSIIDLEYINKKGYDTRN